VKTKVKGLLVQSIWDDSISIDGMNTGEDYEKSEYTVLHREFEIEVELNSLRFDPSNTKLRDEIISTQKVKKLEHLKVQKQVEIVAIEERIQSLLCIEAPKSQ
jgi:hypothetical protein